MMNYRIYRIAEDDRFVGVHEILAASDEDAMLQARQLLDGLDLEVWRGNEKIGYLRSNQAKFEPTDGAKRSSDAPRSDAR
jgi:hypothetical protein